MKCALNIMFRLMVLSFGFWLLPIVCYDIVFCYMSAVVECEIGIHRLWSIVPNEIVSKRFQIFLIGIPTFSNHKLVEHLQVV